MDSNRQAQDLKEMEESKNSFFGIGLLVGVMVTIIIFLTLSVCGMTGYLFLERPQLFPGTVTRTIDARGGWQSSGVWVKPGNRVEVTVVDGVWTHWEGTEPYNKGSGGGYVCGKAMSPDDCVEPLPNYSAGGLIGRVGEEIFPVGTGTIWKSTESGRLELRINDGDVGLNDNDGGLKVEVHIQK